MNENKKSRKFIVVLKKKNLEKSPIKILFNSYILIYISKINEWIMIIDKKFRYQSVKFVLIEINVKLKQDKREI